MARAARSTQLTAVKQTTGKPTIALDRPIAAAVESPRSPDSLEVGKRRRNVSDLGAEIARTVGFIGAALLCAAGASKLWRPAVTAKALSATRLPAGRAPIRVVAVAELVVGAGYFASPGIASAIALSVLYFLFTAFAVRVLRSAGSAVPCGCFGGADSQYSVSHVGFDAFVAAVVAAGTATGAPASLPALTASGVLYLGALALATYVAWLVLVDFGTILVLVRSTGGESRGAIT